VILQRGFCMCISRTEMVYFPSPPPMTTWTSRNRPIAHQYLYKISNVFRGQDTQGTDFCKKDFSGSLASGSPCWFTTIGLSKATWGPCRSGTTSTSSEASVDFPGAVLKPTCHTSPVESTYRRNAGFFVASKLAPEVDTPTQSPARWTPTLTISSDLTAGAVYESTVALRAGQE
jgi:hypothetical protein